MEHQMFQNVESDFRKGREGSKPPAMYPNLANPSLITLLLGNAKFQLIKKKKKKQIIYKRMAFEFSAITF